MPQFLNAPISSLNAIKSTIKTDALVCRWFLYLISQEKAKSDLAAYPDDYTQLKKTIVCQNLCLIVLLGVSLYVILTKHFIVLSAVAIVMFVYFKLLQAVREHVTFLSLKIIAKCFEPDHVSHHTLYQIGERLADQYKIRSLVMSMTSVDNIIRKVLLFALIFIICVFPSNFLSYLIFMFAAYWGASIIVNTAVVYDRLS